MANTELIKHLPERVQKTIIWGIGKIDFKSFENKSIEDCVLFAEKTHDCKIQFEKTTNGYRVIKM